MIHHTQGNLLEADVEAYVNPVNCMGVSGAGLALQFRAAYPENHEAYARACKGSEVQLGKVYIVSVYRKGQFRYIVNFPTKHHWRDNSRLQSIRAGLESLLFEVQARQIKSIAIPALGCGLGGLDWDDVRPLIEEAFSETECEVFLYEPR